MHYVVSYSGGVTSWAAAKLVKDNLKQEDSITLLFADTLMESQDVYDFLYAGAKYLELPVTRISDGRNPFDLFDDVNFLGNDRVAICSRILKRELIYEWRQANCQPETSIHVVGMDWIETNRFEQHRVTMLEIGGWVAIAPLIDYGVPKYQAIQWAKDAKLTIPDAYDEGFAHANCGGMCIRAGKGHWSRLYQIHPDRYRYAEERENKFRERTGKDVSILTEVRDKKTHILTLTELRERLQKQNSNTLFADDGGGCGCALED